MTVSFEELAQALADALHLSEESKWAAGGPVHKSGKAGKGPNYQPPDIAGVLERVRTSEQGEGA